MTQPSWKSLVPPDANSRWDYRNREKTVRVMGVAEGWVIARNTGATPFVTHMSDWHQKFTPKIMPKRQRKGIEKPRMALPSS